MSGVYIYTILRKHQNRKGMSSLVGNNSVTQIPSEERIINFRTSDLPPNKFGQNITIFRISRSKGEYLVSQVLQILKFYDTRFIKQI